MTRRLGCVLAGLLLTSGSAAAQADDLVTGSVRGGYWTSDRLLDDRSNFLPGSIWLKSTPTFGGGFYGRAEGWLGAEPVHEDFGHTKGDLREAMVGWRDDTLDISLGRRVIVWGRADWFNPTDFLANRDYTLLFPSDDDQRRGSVVGSVSTSFGDTTATALWAPEFRPNILPIPREPGVVIRQGTDRAALSQFALRLERAAGGIDWAVSYFNGVDRDPGVQMVSYAPGSVVATAVYNRVQRAGADFATTVGPYGVRGEVAYTDQLSHRGDLFNPNSYVAAVLGADRNVTEHLNVNVQYTLHYVTADLRTPLQSGPLGAVAARVAFLVDQGRRLQHGPTLHLRYSLLNDTLSLELSAMVLLSDHSYAVRPRATYALTDTVKLVFGGDLLRGSQNSLFGAIRRDTTFFGEMQYAF